MSCCKDNLLVYLTITVDQSDQAIKSLKEFINYTDEQANQAVKYAIKNGRCLIYEGTIDEVSVITLNLAKNSLNAQVENKSIK